ncbi:MAG: YodC family protein [Beijerinckiaceae bacterium]
MPAKKTKDAFEVGSTVQLKSGGPALTVLGQAGDRVHCVFFSDEIGEFRETNLHEIALIAIDMVEEDEENEEEDEEEGDEDEDKAA